MQHRQNNEAKLFPAVKRWAEERDFVVYAEVPWPCARGSSFDVVGVRWETKTMVIVELKLSLTEHLLYQCQLATLIGDEVWGAVASHPRPTSMQKAHAAGVGILRVGDGRCSELLLPTRTRNGAEVVRQYRDKVLAGLELSGDAHRQLVGGLPTLKGDGPAQQVYEAVQRYRTDHPQATWRAIFQAVPNHYQHYESLYGAMRLVVIRRADAERRRMNRPADAAQGTDKESERNKP